MGAPEEREEDGEQEAEEQLQEASQESQEEEEAPLSQDEQQENPLLAPHQTSSYNMRNFEPKFENAMYLDDQK